MPTLLHKFAPLYFTLAHVQARMHARTHARTHLDIFQLFADLMTCRQCYDVERFFTNKAGTFLIGVYGFEFLAVSATLASRELMLP